MNRKQLVITVCCLVAVSAVGVVIGKVRGNTEELAEADDLPHRPLKCQEMYLELTPVIGVEIQQSGVYLNPVCSKSQNCRNQWTVKALRTFDPNRRMKLTKILERMIAGIG